MFYPGSSIEILISVPNNSGVSPAELLMGRHVRTRFDLLYPDISQKVESQQLKQKLSHDNAKPVRSFQVDDLVYAENLLTHLPSGFKGKSLKLPSTSIFYQVELESGLVVHRHVDSVRSRRPNTTVELCDSGQVDPLVLPDLHPTFLHQKLLPCQLPLLLPPVYLRSLQLLLQLNHARCVGNYATGRNALIIVTSNFSEF